MGEVYYKKTLTFHRNILHELQEYLGKIRDRAHSKIFGENAYEKALEPKELSVVEDAVGIAGMMHDAQVLVFATPI